MKLKIFVWLFFLFFSLQSAMALTVVENFASLPTTTNWNYYNNSNCTPSIVAGGLLLNVTPMGKCYWVLNKALDSNETITITWQMKMGGTDQSSVGGLTVTELDASAFDSATFGGATGSCHVNLYTQESTPTDYYGKRYNNPSALINDTITNPLNTTFQEFKMILTSDAGTWPVPGVHTIEFFIDDVLRAKNDISTGICANNSNLTIIFGANSIFTTGTSRLIYFDALIVQATGYYGALPACPEPCNLNETFNYDDSICDHGWVAGDCTDLNNPINEQYVCNDSSQVIASYFPKITKDSGLITFSYDLLIGSNYDVLIGLGSQEEELAAMWIYDDGKIIEQRDFETIGTYSYNVSYKYKFIFDLEHWTYDFYIDEVLQTENIAFYNMVDNLYYFFIQPDYNKGFPYCDYTLDNVELIKGISLPPEDSEEYWQVGDFFNLDPTNASFDWTNACTAQEHPTLCFTRVVFQEITTGFTTFFFANFLLFLVLIVVILVIVMIRRH